MLVNAVHPWRTMAGSVLHHLIMNQLTHPSLFFLSPFSFPLFPASLSACLPPLPFPLFPPFLFFPFFLLPLPIPYSPYSVMRLLQSDPSVRLVALYFCITHAHTHTSLGHRWLQNIFAMESRTIQAKTIKTPSYHREVFRCGQKDSFCPRRNDMSLTTLFCPRRKTFRHGL